MAEGVAGGLEAFGGAQRAIDTRSCAHCAGMELPGRVLCRLLEPAKSAPTQSWRVRQLALSALAGAKAQSAVRQKVCGESVVPEMEAGSCMLGSKGFRVVAAGAQVSGFSRW